MTITTRFDRLDALRGLALVWMTAYHLAFDLNHFGFIHQNFYENPFWTWQRTAIVSLFLFTAGFSQVVAVERGQSWPRFWRRWGQIVGCALLVSLASWWMFSQSWISFGVLHGLAVMLLLVRATLMQGWWRGVWPWFGAGVLILLTPWLLHAAQTYPESPWVTALDSRWLNGLGVVSHKPFTEDYVPLLPWLGVVLLGVAAARVVPRQFLARAVGSVGHGLVLAGRFSLSYYMVHQPVLLVILMLVK